MPKYKVTALKKARNLFLTRSADTDFTDSDSSEKSEEYSHIPIKNLCLSLEDLKMEPQHDTPSPLEAINEQLARMMQAIEIISAKQAQYDIQNGSTSSPHSQSVNPDRPPRAMSGDPFRIPDPIKLLPTFNGNKKQLNWWLETAENTLSQFQTLVPPEIFQIYLTAISNKIEGHAKDVLCTNGNPTTFAEIKNILIAALGDKQDLSTYNCQLWHNKMDGSISKHYQRSKQLVYNIKSLAKQNPKYNQHWDAVNDFIDEYSLAAYVSGLQKPYFGYVQAAEPKSIENAYAFLCKFTSNESNRNLTQTLSPKPKGDSHFPRIMKPENNNQSNQRSGNSKFENNNKQSYKPFKPEHHETPNEAMDVGSVKTKLTLNKRLNNHELAETEGEDEDADVNFTIDNQSDTDD